MPPFKVYKVMQDINQQLYERKDTPEGFIPVYGVVITVPTEIYTNGQKEFTCDKTHFAEKYIEDAPVYYTPEKGKIYVDISESTDYSGKTYRWSGTKYSVISETLALGEVTGTAYDGGKGKKTTDIVNSLSSEFIIRLDRVDQTTEGLKIIYSKSVKSNNTNLYIDKTTCK